MALCLTDLCRNDEALRVAEEAKRVRGAQASRESQKLVDQHRLGLGQTAQTTQLDLKTVIPTSRPRLKFQLSDRRSLSLFRTVGAERSNDEGVWEAT